MTRWRMAGFDRLQGVTICYARVAWLAVMVMRVRAFEVPDEAVSEWRRLADAERPPVRVWWSGNVMLGSQVSVGLCLWRDARWCSP